MKRSIFLVLGLCVLSVFTANAAVIEHFHNDPKNIDPDPAYIPGDHALPEVFASRTYYQAQKDKLAEGGSVLSIDRLFTIGSGEVTFAAIKNESAEVLGHFRNYFGTVDLKDGLPARMDMLIDINSLDTSVPGRNNRIMDLFFQSAKPEFGTAVIAFDRFDLNGKGLDLLQDGNEHGIGVSGHITLNGVDRPLTAQLTVQKKGLTWSAKTTEPIELLLTDFGFEERIPEFLKSCNHRSLGNRVAVTVHLYLR